MSEFQKQDQLEPKSNGAVQPTEAVELDGYLLDTNTSSGADLSSGGADLNKTIERVRQQEQWLSAPQEVIEIEMEERLVIHNDDSSGTAADADGIELNPNSDSNNGDLDRRRISPVSDGDPSAEPSDELANSAISGDDSWLTANTQEPSAQPNRANKERRSEQPRVSRSSSRLEDDSKELPELGRLELGKADEQGKLLEAIQQSFDPAISAEAYQIAQQFIAGISEPTVSWADFDSELIQGAYISESNEILLNKAIAKRPEILQQVLIEELGHWIDDQAHGLGGGDSNGDEGRRFAQALQPSTINSSNTSSNDHVLMELDGRLVQAELSYTSTIPRPVRLDQGPRALVIIEDGATTDLGLAGLQWIEEAKLNRATGSRSAEDPAQINQRLTFEVTGLPDPQLGKILKADNSALQIGGLDIADLQGLKFQGNADAHGESFFNYQITNGANATSTEEFRIQMLAVNDNPQGDENFIERVISTEDLIEGDGGAFEAVSLGLGDTDDFRLNFGSGDPNKDPGSANAQTLRYVIEQLPDPEFGTLQLNSVDVALNQELTLEQIKQLSLQVSTDIATRELSQRVDSIQIAIRDSGIIPTGGERSNVLEINVSITKPQGSLQELVNIPGFNPSTDLTPEQIAELSEGAMFQETGDGDPQFLNPSLYGQVSEENPLYLAEIGGSGSIDDDEINYSSLNVPFMFDIPMNTLDGTSYTNGGDNPTHELIYKPSLNGQFRDNNGDEYSLQAPAPSGFSIKSNGKWKLDLSHADYLGWATGRKETLTINYDRSGTALNMTIDLVMGEHALVASASGAGAEQSSMNRGFWVKSNAEGKEKDRYFKYINEFVLTSYGAQKVGTNEETGDGIFSWAGAANTADGQPLKLLDGTVITESGYYDFTRRDGAGDGVEFLYETVSEDGEDVDYIVGMRYFIRNNMYGDNDAAADNIRDPGSGIALMRELGVVTTEADGADTIIRVLDSSENAAAKPTVVNAESYDAFDSDAIDDSVDSAIQEALQSQTSTSEGISGKLLTPEVGISDQSDTASLLEGDSGSADSSELTLSAAIGPFQEVTIDEEGLDEEDEDKEGEKKGSGDDPLGENDGAGDQLRKRGLRFTSAPGTSAEAASKPLGLLESLANVDLLGTNLLDGLAIGLGLLYLLYGPGQIRSTQQPIRQWIGGITGKSSRHALALFWISTDGGSDQLVAAEIRPTRLQLVAQAELASQNGPQPLEQSIGQILSQLKSHRGGTLLLDPRLLAVVEQDPAILKQFKNYSRSPLEPAAYSSVLAAMNQDQLQAIRAWLASPQLESADAALLELLKTRAQAFEDRLDRERATIATSIELSLALALMSN